MNLRVIFVSAILVCFVSACQSESSPAFQAARSTAAQAPPVSYVTFKDPAEHAFSIQVPRAGRLPAASIGLALSIRATDPVDGQQREVWTNTGQPHWINGSDQVVDSPTQPGLNYHQLNTVP